MRAMSQPSTAPTTRSTSATARALTASDRATEAAGVRIREVHELADLARVCEVFRTLWIPDPTNPVTTVEVLRAYAHTGQYVVLAEDLTAVGRPVVAASVGYFAAPPGVALHSNVTGVLPVGRGRSLGYALKLHQRAWALARGLAEVTWTFDPLIRRNAWFNLAKLGARVRDYLIDFYGPMGDAVNAGDASDRLYLAWPLADDRVVAAVDGQPLVIDPDAERSAGGFVALAVDDAGGPRLHWPAPDGARVVLAQVPPDVEALRRKDAAVARQWRLALRQVLAGLLADGWQVRGTGPDGWYVLDRGTRSEEPNR
jgi:predicted GNAT superfamily acetyltransferase